MLTAVYVVLCIVVGCVVGGIGDSVKNFGIWAESLPHELFGMLIESLGALLLYGAVAYAIWVTVC